MRPRIAFEPLTDCFGALGAHDKKDVRRAFQRAARTTKSFASPFMKSACSRYCGWSPKPRSDIQARPRFRMTANKVMALRMARNRSDGRETPSRGSESDVRDASRRRIWKVTRSSLRTDSPVDASRKQSRWTYNSHPVLLRNSTRLWPQKTERRPYTPEPVVGTVAKHVSYIFLGMTSKPPKG